MNRQHIRTLQERPIKLEQMESLIAKLRKTGYSPSAEYWRGDRRIIATDIEDTDSIKSRADNDNAPRSKIKIRLASPELYIRHGRFGIITSSPKDKKQDIPIVIEHAFSSKKISPNVVTLASTMQLQAPIEGEYFATLVWVLFQMQNSKCSDYQKYSFNQAVADITVSAETEIEQILKETMKKARLLTRYFQHAALDWRLEVIADLLKSHEILTKQRLIDPSKDTRGNQRKNYRQEFLQKTEMLPQDVERRLRAGVDELKQTIPQVDKLLESFVSLGFKIS